MTAEPVPRSVADGRGMTDSGQAVLLRGFPTKPGESVTYSTSLDSNSRFTARPMKARGSFPAGPFAGSLGRGFGLFGGVAKGVVW